MANALYVALTRARSVLVCSGAEGKSEVGDGILGAVGECFDDQVEASKPNAGPSRLDNGYELARRVGREHVAWLQEIANRFALRQEPIEDEGGSVVAEPLFWCEGGGARFACFVEAPAEGVRSALEESGVHVVRPGQPVGE